MNYILAYENGQLIFRIPVYPNAGLKEIERGVANHLRSDVFIKIYLNGREIEIKPNQQIGDFNEGKMEIVRIKSNIPIKIFPEEYPTQIFDLLMYEEVELSEVLEEDNIVFYLIEETEKGTEMTHPFMYPRDELKRILEDRDVYRECKKQLLGAPRLQDVYETSYFKISGPSGQYVVTGDQFTGMIYSKHQIFGLKRGLDILDYTASVKNIVYNPVVGTNIYGERVNIVSGYHCQEGSNQTVSKIYRIF